MFYPKSDPLNAAMRWYWSAAEGTGTPGSSDMILDETRSSDDGTIFNDYVLLEKYKKGRFLQVTTTTGDMTIAEVLMTFAEMRKPPLNATHGMCDSLSYRYIPSLVSSDTMPPLKDCFEVKNYGVGAPPPGLYQLDTTGNNTNSDAPLVPCEDGWTHILVREPLCCPVNEPFQRSYQEFVDGFSVGSEFWIGLKRASE